MSHERVSVSAAEQDDLDGDALAEFLRHNYGPALAQLTPDEVAVRAGFLAKMGGKLTSSLAGLYLFGRFPELVFPEWGVLCFAFDGPHLTCAMRTKRELGGPLPQLIEQAEQFALSEVADRAPLVTAAGSTVDGALREVIVNALVHRDLRRSSRVTIRSFSDRIEVWSPGGPVEGVTDLEELMREGGVSTPRNPILAGAARRLGLSDLAGRGLPRLGELTLPGGIGRPEIRSTPRDVLVSLPAPARVPAAALS